jgi:hypothetical protein
MLDIANQLGRRQSTKIDGRVAEVYAERSEQAQRDLLLILEYLAERTTGEEANNVDIREAARLCAIPYGSLEEAQKGEIWVLMSRLTRLIAPATVEGLRGTRRGSGWPTLFSGVVITFLVALSLQVYVALGSQALGRLDNASAELAKVYTAMNAMEQDRYAFSKKTESREETESSKKTNPSSEETESSKKTWPPSYNQLQGQLDSIKGAMGVVFRDIYDWNGMWARPLARLYGQNPGDFWGFECKESESEECKSFRQRITKLTDAPTNFYKKEDLNREWDRAPFGLIQIRYSTETVARSNLETLRNLVLPVLYGALGAWVWLLRQRYLQVLDRRIRTPVWGEYMQRVLLGAVFGAAVGYLEIRSFLPESLANVSLIGLAFVVGYNVEVVFWLFDQMFSAMRERRTERKQDRAKRRESARRREASRRPEMSPPSGPPARSVATHGIADGGEDILQSPARSS